MNRRGIAVAWIVTTAAMSISGGLSWFDVGLTPAAGGQGFEVSGFMAFPVISALVLLQAAAMFSSLFSSGMVGKIIAAALIPIQLWHVIAVVSSLDTAVQFAVGIRVAEITGVVGGVGQGEFIQSTSQTVMWGVYIFAVALNLLVLALRVSFKVEPTTTKPIVPADHESEDLWESQR